MIAELALAFTLAQASLTSHHIAYNALGDVPGTLIVLSDNGRYTAFEQDQDSHIRCVARGVEPAMADVGANCILISEISDSSWNLTVPYIQNPNTGEWEWCIAEGGYFDSPVQWWPWMEEVIEHR